MKRTWDTIKKKTLWLGHSRRSAFFSISSTLESFSEKLFSLEGQCVWMEGHNKEKQIQTSYMHPRFEIKILAALCLSITKHKQTGGHRAGTACAAYHRTLRTAVLEAARSFFVETVVRSWGFGHLLHDNFGFHILLCSGIYCDMGTLKQHDRKVDFNAQTNRKHR